jgi:hypothetical protein
MNLNANGRFIVSGDEGMLPDITNLLRLAKQTVVITASRIDATLSNEIIDAAKNGVRVYLLLANEGFDDWLKGKLDALAEHVLCRRSSLALPSLVLIDGETANAKGILMQSGTAIDRSLKVEGAAWGLNLNSEQCGQLAHHVSWLFWSANGSRSETRCSRHLKAPQDTKPLRASLSKMPTNTDISVNAKDEGGKFFTGIKKIEEFSAIGFSAFDLKDIGGIEIDRRLSTAILTEPGEVRSGDVSADASSNKVVALVSADGATGWLFDWIPDAEAQADHQVALRLDEKQAKTFNSIISKSTSKTEWKLMNDIGLSTLKVGSDVRLANGKSKTQILEKQTIDLGAQTVTPWNKKRLSEFEPHATSRPECEPLVKTVEWTWKNVPPCPPKDAKPDLIERQFSDAIKMAKKAEKYIRERLSTHEKKGEKALKKLETVTKKLSEDIRLSSDLKAWCSALQVAEGELKKLEDGGDSDIQRKKKTAGIEIPEVPEGNRPSVGSLRGHGKSRFLAIDSWDDFESGSKEAEKQNAELCVTREVLDRKPE